jgi:pimeloyl-ACP methyl ester carboxylesterase
MKRLIKEWWWIILPIPVIGLVGFIAWAQTPLGPMPQALSALESDTRVEVQTEPWIIFRPVNQTSTAGVIFYPGGRVDPRSYAPPAREIASRGYLVIIVPMPFNLAVFAYDRASQVMDAYPEISQWAIGGHSLGGAMAANYTYQNPSRVQGVFFWAAYPASNIDLSDQNLPVTSISASKDGISTPDEIDTSRMLLPEDTTWIIIEGGNHAQFGWYGNQNGDNPATISRQSQQVQTVHATLKLLTTIESDE